VPNRKLLFCLSLEIWAQSGQGLQCPIQHFLLHWSKFFLDLIASNLVRIYDFERFWRDKFKSFYDFSHRGFIKIEFLNLFYSILVLLPYFFKLIFSCLIFFVFSLQNLQKFIFLLQIFSEKILYAFDHWTVQFFRAGFLVVDFHFFLRLRRWAASLEHAHHFSQNRNLWCKIGHLASNFEDCLKSPI
jgi:hypothetical protein